LRARTDAQLAELLRRRPDLGLPAPVDLAILANRVTVRTSVQRAVDSLDAWRLRVLEALVLAGPPDGKPDPALARELLGAGSPGRADDVTAAINDLNELALVWGDDGELNLAPNVLESLGSYPAGLGRLAAILLRSVSDLALAPVLRSLQLAPVSQPRSGLSIARALADPEVLDKLIAGADAEERAVLDRLAAGPPLGLVRAAQPTGGDDAPPPPPNRLIQRGLLVAIDARTVELPREVGLRLRGLAPLADVTTSPPMVETGARSPADADRAGTAAVLALVRLVDSVADEWSRHPPAVLRTGGVGVRELRRIARAVGVDEATAALVIEVAAAAGLIGATNGIDPTYLPTPEYDTWVREDPAQRWVTLATSWLAMTRQPSLIGQRDERERVVTVLGPDAERGAAPALRRNVLGALVTLTPGAVPAGREQVLARLAWLAPRRAVSQRAATEAVLAEADLIALTSAGGLTGYGRAILIDAPATARDALAAALPEPVDHFVVQPDLTIVVPGPPTADVGRELALIADLESTGGASVYRVSDQSVRRALDAGSSAGTLIATLTRRSTTALPQALTYLIEDVARRHGVLRAGVATAYLRCDDSALLARVVSERAVRTLDLHLIATTVAISSAPVNRVLDVLREAGFAPAAEGVDGSVVSLVGEAPRAPSRSTRLARIRPDTDLAAHASELVRRMRAGDAAVTPARGFSGERTVHSWTPGLGIPGVTSAAMLGTIRDAVRAGERIDVGYADGSGGATRHTILPISMAGGSVRGHESTSRQLLTLALHRITDVTVLPDDLSDPDESDDPDDDGRAVTGKADNGRFPEMLPPDARQET
jgi:hypothetical protein